MRYLHMAVFIAAMLSVRMAMADGTLTASAGKYTVALTTDPTPPMAGPVQVTLTVQDGGSPVSGAIVTLHANMEDRSLPTDVATTAGAQSGQYVATLNLSKPGEWDLTPNIQSMAGMAMAGDGKATFSVTILPAPGGAATTLAMPPAPPAHHSGMLWPLLLVLFIIIGAVIAMVVVRGRGRQYSTQKS